MYDFDLITHIMGYGILAVIIGLIVSIIVHHKKYTETYRDDITGETVVKYKKGAPKNTVGRILAWSLPFLFIGFGATCAILGFAQDGNFDLQKDGYIIWWILVVCIFGFFMLILPVLIIKAIASAVRKYREHVDDKVFEAQSKIENNKAEELEIMKNKYKPIKCEFCGTMNSPKRSNCKNCGAVLQNKDNRLL